MRPHNEDRIRQSVTSENDTNRNQQLAPTVATGRLCNLRLTRKKKTNITTASQLSRISHITAFNQFTDSPPKEQYNYFSNVATQFDWTATFKKVNHIEKEVRLAKSKCQETCSPSALCGVLLWSGIGQFTRIVLGYFTVIETVDPITQCHVIETLANVRW